MTKNFYAATIIFGDYNSSNILVTDEFKPLLVDLDSVCTFDDPLPALRMGGPEGFQPPAKLPAPSIFKNHPEIIDAFREYVIYHLIFRGLRGGM